MNVAVKILDGIIIFQIALAVPNGRVLAVRQFSFLKRLAKLTHQEKFIAALKHNVNLFKRIKADSLVGRQARLKKDVVVGARTNPADLAKVQQALAQGQTWPNTDLAANVTKLFKTNPDFVAENAGSTVGGAVSSSVLMLNYLKSRFCLTSLELMRPKIN